MTMPRAHSERMMLQHKVSPKVVPREPRRRTVGGASGASGESDSPELLTIRELASRLTVSVGCIRARRLRGEGPPAIRVGTSLRWDKREVAAWLDANRESRMCDGRAGLERSGG